MNTVMSYTFNREQIQAIEHHIEMYGGFLACGHMDYSMICEMCEFNHYRKGYMYIKLCQKGLYPISMTTLKRFFLWNKVSTVDNLFEDAFIIISEQDLKLLPVLSKLDALNNRKEQVIIAIDGYAASGKTTLASKLAKIFDGNVFHMDDFYKKPVINPKDTLSMYGSNIDFDKINDTIVDPITMQKPVIYHPFNVITHTHIDPIKIPYRKFIIFEGAYSMHPYMKIAYDYTIFYDISKTLQIKRIYKRNGFKKLVKFIHTWIPNEKKYAKKLNIRQKADSVLVEKTT